MFFVNMKKMAKYGFIPVILVILMKTASFKVEVNVSEEEEPVFTPSEQTKRVNLFDIDI